MEVWNMEVWKFGILMCGSLEYEGMEVLKLSISFHVASSCGHILYSTELYVCSINRDSGLFIAKVYKCMIVV